MLTQKKAEAYRKLLNKRLEAIAAELKEAAERKEKDEEDGKAADWTDIATSETAKTMELKIRDRDKLMFDEIQSALQRIENETYGECKSCGEFITDSRLQARPTTTLCIDCMTEIEASTHRYR